MNGGGGGNTTTSAGGGGGGLFPSVFNLAATAEITSNATCGQNEPEIYCKLVEHVYVRAPQCGVGSVNSSNSSSVNQLAGGRLINC